MIWLRQLYGAVPTDILYFPARLSSRRRTLPFVLEELSGVREGPMIISMPTTARSSAARRPPASESRPTHHSGSMAEACPKGRRGSRGASLGYRRPADRAEVREAEASSKAFDTPTCRRSVLGRVFRTRRGHATGRAWVTRLHPATNTDLGEKSKSSATVEAVFKTTAIGHRTVRFY
jgi:hypothetical protein